MLRVSQTSLLCLCEIPLMPAVCVQHRHRGSTLNTHRVCVLCFFFSVLWHRLEKRITDEAELTVNRGILLMLRGVRRVFVSCRVSRGGSLLSLSRSASRWSSLLTFSNPLLLLLCVPNKSPLPLPDMKNTTCFTLMQSVENTRCKTKIQKYLMDPWGEIEFCYVTVAPI